MITMEPFEYDKYDRAKKRMKQIKGFYSHVKVYLIVNVLIILARIYAGNYINFDAQDEGFRDWLNWNIMLTPILWGIVLLIHGISVNRFKLKLFKDWEDKKIKEYIDKENNTHEHWD